MEMPRAEPSATLLSLVEENLPLHEDKTAVLYDTGDTKEFLTYRDIWSTASKVKAVLKQYSVENSVVGLCLEQDKHIPAIILGVMCSEAAFYNFEPESTGFFSQVIQEIHITVLIIDIRRLTVLQDLIFKFEGQLSPFDVPECPHTVLIELRGVSRKNHHSGLAYCITTSGTTGLPKIVQVPHCCIVPNIIHIRHLYSLTSDDLVLLCSPLTFDPFIVELFTSLSVGACVLIVPRTVKLSPDRLLEIIYHRNKVTVMQCTPSLLRRWKPGRVRETILGTNSALRVMSLGGEQFPSMSELLSMRANRNQTRFYNLYGITEVSSWATCYEVTKFGADSEVHLGYPMLDTEIKVCDDGQCVDEGLGRIFIGGKKRQCIIGSEEVEQYDVTVTKWRDTGDIGRITKDGLIYYIGRVDSQIKRQGKRLNVEEINQVISEIVNIRCCSAQMIDDRLVLFVVSDLWTSLSDNFYHHIAKEATEMNKICQFKTAVIDMVRRRLPSQYMPDDVVVIENLPVTKHGKVDAHKLKETYRKDHSNAANPTECLTRAWKAVLCIDCPESVSDSSMFLECGGDSFKAVKLLNNLELELLCKFPNLLDVLMNKSFKTLLDYIQVELNRHNKENVQKVITRVNTLSSSVKNDKILAMIDADNEDMIVNKAEINTDISTLSKTESPSEVNINNLDNIEFSIVSDDFESRSKTKTMIQDMISFRNSKNQIVNDNCNSDPVSPDSIYVDKIAIPEDIFIGGEDGSVLTKIPEERMDNEKQDLHKIVFLKANSKRPVIRKENNEIKRIKTHTHNFYKFIQRGNKIYKIPEIMRSRNSIKCHYFEFEKDCEQLMDKIQAPNSGEPEKECSFIDTDKYSNIEQYGSLDTKKLQIDLIERWSLNTGKCVDASPLLAVSSDLREDVIFIGSHSHKFCAVSMATGYAIWEITLGGRIESSACMSHGGNYVVVGCYDGSIYVISAESGNIIWQYQTGAVVKSSPTVDMTTGLIYVGSHSHCLYAISIQERQCVWKLNPNCGSIFSSPVVSHHPHRVYVGTLGGYLIAVEAVTGEEVWRYDLGKPIFSSPCLSADGVIVGCVDCYLYHLTHQGTLVWMFEMKGPIFSSPISWNSSLSADCSDFENDSNEMEVFKIDKYCSKNMSSEFKGTDRGNVSLQEKNTRRNHIVCGCHGNRVYCLTEQGKLLWEIETESPVYSTPFLDRISATDQQSVNDIPVAFGLSENLSEQSHGVSKGQDDKTYSHLLCSLDNQRSFDKKFKKYCPSKSDALKINDSNEDSHVLNIAAFASTKGILYLVNIETGTFLCKHKLDGEVFSSPIVNGNRLIIGCRNNVVYCFDIVVKKERK